MTKREYYTRLVNAMKENFEAYSTLKAEYDKLTQERQSGTYSVEHINKVIYPRQSELKKAMESAQRKAHSDVDALTKEMGSYLRSLDTLRPEDMTDDVKLFSSGVTLSKRDIQDIIDRNPDNRTMVQLALRYASEKGIQGLEYTHYVSSESQTRNFENIQYCADTVIKWFDKPDGYDRMYSQLIGEGSDTEAFCMAE